MQKPQPPVSFNLYDRREVAFPADVYRKQQAAASEAAARSRVAFAGSGQSLGGGGKQPLEEGRTIGDDEDAAPRSQVCSNPIASISMALQSARTLANKLLEDTGMIKSAAAAEVEADDACVLPLTDASKGPTTGVVFRLNFVRRAAAADSSEEARGAVVGNAPVIFNTSATVGDLYAYVAQQQRFAARAQLQAGAAGTGDSGAQEQDLLVPGIELIAGFPPKPLSRESDETLQDAGLLQAVVTQRKLS
jgi:hypothetical protein